MFVSEKSIDSLKRFLTFYHYYSSLWPLMVKATLVVCGWKGFYSGHPLEKAI